MALAAMALWQAEQAGVQGAAAVPDVLRGLVAAIAFYGIGGYALTRLLLPVAMRPHWPLFVLPVGGMATGLLMTFLGFAGAPYKLNLILTIGAGAAGAFLVLRSRGGALEPRAWIWPAYVAALVVAVALIPVLRSGFATVVGEGSDGHLATGTATFLKHGYPTATEPELPVDKVPLVWRSKYPIYYSLAGVSTLAGLDTVETIATLAALLLALAALGFFLLTRHLLRAPPAAALLAMGLVGLNAMAIFTVTHPYFNQTWGLVAMPYMILLGWWALSEPRGGTIALALVFAAVGAFAYPLMLAFPGAAFAGFVFFRARQRRREGHPVDWLAPFRRLSRRKRWYPLYALAALLLAVPVLGVIEKVVSGFIVVIEGRSLKGWAGDIRHYYPVHDFLSLVEPGGIAGLLALAVAFLAWRGLKGAPRAARRALLVTVLAAVWFAGYFHRTADGQYFYFKTMAYLGPLVVTLAAVGLGRLAVSRRQWLQATGASLAIVYLTMASLGARDQIAVTFDQVTPRHRELMTWDRTLPANTSIRLDVEPTKQIWVAYFLHHHPLTSQNPLDYTSYPHVPEGRKADFVVTERRYGRPKDATGSPIRQNRDFVLYRMRPSVPGPDVSSREMVQPIKSIPLA